MIEPADWKSRPLAVLPQSGFVQIPNFSWLPKIDLAYLAFL